MSRLTLLLAVVAASATAKYANVEWEEDSKLTASNLVEDPNSWATSDAARVNPHDFEAPDVELLERRVSKGKSGGRSRDLKNMTRGLALKVAKAARTYVNEKLADCNEDGQEAPAPYTRAAATAVNVRVVSGLLITASVDLSRDDGTTRSFTLEVRKQKTGNPMAPPSSRTAEGAGDPLAKFSVHTVDPDPCSQKAAEAAQFTQYDYGVERAYGHIDPPAGVGYTKLISLSDEEKAALPSSWDWREKAPSCLALKEVLDQKSCGSCWAQASASAMGARMCIQSKGVANPKISQQFYTSCGKETGCSGGHAYMAYYEGMKKQGGAVDEQCDPYTGKDASNPCGCEECNDVSNQCMRYHNKKADPNGYHEKYAYAAKVKASSGTSQEDALKKELMENGPFYIAFTVYSDFNRYRGGVYSHQSGGKSGGHAVTLIGWGEESGTPYWLLQNSWGSNWGTKGFFKMKRGSDECGIESRSPLFGVPDLDKLCKNECQHGSMDSSCKCTCTEGWGGSACDQCIRSCSGQQYTGQRDDAKCQCECKEGFFGATCTLKVDLPSTVNSGEAATMSYSGSGIRQGDKIVAFKADETPWTAKGGWAKASSTAGVVCGESKAGDPTPCPDSGSTTFKIYEEGTYKIILLRYLGHNEFGKDKGFANSFSNLGQVTVQCGSGGCKGMPDPCVDKQGWCARFKRYCPQAKYMTIMAGGVRHNMAATCLKTCNLCQTMLSQENIEDSWEERE